MHTIVVLTPSGEGCGFALAGVRQQETCPAEAWSALQAVCADPAVGVAAVDARLLAAIEPRQLQELSSRWGGVLVTLPAPAGAEPPELDELQRLIRRALGYHVRLEL